MDPDEYDAESARLRKNLAELSGGKCEKCGRPITGGGWRMHRQGGTNLMVLCEECHGRMDRSEARFRRRDVFKEAVSGRRQEEYKMLNGMVFLVFVLLAVIALFVGLPVDFFYRLVVVWVHEAGHGFFCLGGEGVLCSFGGFLMEMLFSIVPAMICLTRREMRLAGFVMLMCAGFSVMHNGVYMQSSEHPMGTSFAGALTGRYDDISVASHDWTMFFSEYGLLDDAAEIGFLTEGFGRAVSLVFLSAALFYFLPAVAGRDVLDHAGAAALFSAVYFTASEARGVELYTCIAIAAPAVLRAVRDAVRWGLRR
ncbi:MAG: HNH endonuclease signature motif containing protein [Candidatus Altiarchaeota archaeon]|nr:HNH endonuclease signature motif containing protein [Candidatus Altiarchaeota archaeon]